MNRDVLYPQGIERRQGQASAKIILKNRVEEPTAPALKAMTETAP